VLLSEKDDNTTVTAGVGDTVEVALNENPTTGYRWEITDFDSRIVSGEGSSFSVSPEAMIGAAGTRRITFRARNPGVVRIELILRRSWESANDAIARWAITIEVHDGQADDGHGAAEPT
jgi:inhibitor of cysteine peptidase